MIHSSVNADVAGDIASGDFASGEGPTPMPQSSTLYALNWAILGPSIGGAVVVVALIITLYVQVRQRRRLHASLLAEQQQEAQMMELVDSRRGEDVTAAERMASALCPTYGSRSGDDEDLKAVIVESVNNSVETATFVAPSPAPSTAPSTNPSTAPSATEIATGSDLVKGDRVWYSHRRLGWIEVRVDKVDYEGVFDADGATYCVSSPQLDGVIETVRARLEVQQPTD